MMGFFFLAISTKWSTIQIRSSDRVKEKGTEMEERLNKDLYDQARNDEKNMANLRRVIRVKLDQVLYYTDQADLDDRMETIRDLIVEYRFLHDAWERLFE